MRKIILVGTGDYYKNIVSSSLNIMKKEGLLELFATCSRDLKDLNKPDVFSRIEHIGRSGPEKLSVLLSDFRNEETIVLLSHANKFHTPDAEDLVRNNFKVIVEKPYCINKSQLGTLQNLISSQPDKIGLLEYYLTMKSIPLLILAGEIKKDSFYFKKEGLLKKCKGLRSFVDNITKLSGRIEEFIGKPKFVLVDLFEGEGQTGRLNHRGASLCDLRKGGGMIQDLGIHAVSPLFALEDYLGNIDESFKKGKVRIAKCKEYIQMVKRKFGLPNNYIGETYAEIEFSTSKSVPIKVSVGKYVLNNKNQRKMVIIGSKGKAFLDLSSCSLFLSTNNRPEIKIIEIPQKPSSKYYPVIRAGLEVLEGHSPFSFNVRETALRAQLFILNVLEKAYLGKIKIGLYKSGVLPQDIFK